MYRITLPLLAIAGLFLTLVHVQTAVGQWEPMTGIRGRATDGIVCSGPALYALYKSDNTHPTACLRSLDSGKHWSTIGDLSAFNDLSSTYATGFYAKDSFIVVFSKIANHNKLVYTSHDFGNHFTSVDLYESDASNFSSSSAAIGDGKIYLTGSGHAGSKDSFVNILSSTDFGSTWQVDPATVITTSSLGNSYEFGGYLFSTGSYSLYRRNLTTLALDSIKLPKGSSPITITDDGKYLYVSSSLTLRSTDLGEHWDTIRVSSGFYRVDNFFYFYGALFAYDYDTVGPLPTIRSPFFHYWNAQTGYTVQGKYGIVATKGGIFRCTIGNEDWTLIDTALTSRKLVKIYKLSGGLYAFSESGLHLSTDKGVTWRHLATPAGPDWETEATSASLLSGTPTNLWYLSATTGMWRSTNNGSSWTAIKSPNAATKQGLVAIGTATVMGHLDGVQRSTDAGMNWTYLHKHDYADHPLVDAGSILYAPQHDKAPEYSSDLGLTWHPVADPLRYDNGNLLAFDGSNVIGHFVSVNGNDTLFRSTNKGGSWTRLTNSKGWPSALTLQGKRVAAAQGVSVDTSSDLGTSWHTIVDTLPSSALALIYADGYLYATTRSEGALRLRTQPTLSVLADKREITSDAVEITLQQYRTMMLRSRRGEPIENIQVYNESGRECSVAITTVSKDAAELHFSGAGAYFITMVVGGVSILEQVAVR